MSKTTIYRYGWMPIQHIINQLGTFRYITRQSGDNLITITSRIDIKYLQIRKHLNKQTHMSGWNFHLFILREMFFSSNQETFYVCMFFTKPVISHQIIFWLPFSHQDNHGEPWFNKISNAERRSRRKKKRGTWRNWNCSPKSLNH